MIAAETRRRRLKKLALALRCPACLRPWALELIAVPTGRAMACKYCHTERSWSFPTQRRGV